MREKIGRRRLGGRAINSYTCFGGPVSFLDAHPGCPHAACRCDSASNRHFKCPATLSASGWHRCETHTCTCTASAIVTREFRARVLTGLAPRPNGKRDRACLSKRAREGGNLHRFYQIKKKTRDKEINGTRTESRGLTGKPAGRPIRVRSRDGTSSREATLSFLRSAYRPSVADIPFPLLQDFSTARPGRARRFRQRFFDRDRDLIARNDRHVSRGPLVW